MFIDMLTRSRFIFSPIFYTFYLIEYESRVWPSSCSSMGLGGVGVAVRHFQQNLNSAGLKLELCANTVTIKGIAFLKLGYGT